MQSPYNLPAYPMAVPMGYPPVVAAAVPRPPAKREAHEARHVGPDKHWSGVAKGESFYVTLEFDPKMYEVSQVQVLLRRNPTTGLTESAEAQWRWAVQSPFGEGRQKVMTAAKASGWFTPPQVATPIVGEEEVPLAPEDLVDLEASVAKVDEAMRHLFTSGDIVASSGCSASGSEVVGLLLQTPSCKKDHDLYMKSISKCKSRSRGLSAKSRTFVNHRVRAHKTPANAPSLRTFPLLMSSACFIFLCCRRSTRPTIRC